MIKAVLQSIPVYWASIAYIPKGILTKIRKTCFSFLWTTSKQNEGIPLTKWTNISLPKEFGGWGIKNPMLFSRALDTKSLWRLVQNTNTLWGRVLCSKYFPDTTLLEWFRSPNKSFRNGSIGWKAMILSFRLIRNWTTWKIGNERSVRLGEDPWAGVGEDYKLPVSVITQLREKICFKLVDVQVHQPIPQGRTSWENS